MADTQPFASSAEAAQRYEQNIVQPIIKSHTHVVFDHVSLHKGERVLDVACGTGIVTRVAAERCDHVDKFVGLDQNPAMLAVARENSPISGVYVEWRQGDACKLPFPNDSFDIVFCQQGMQYVADKLAALQEMKRVLVPGGRLVFTVWSAPHPHTAALADALRHQVHSEAAMSVLSASEWGDAETIRQIVDEVGFHAVEMEVIASIGRLSSSADSVHSWVAYQGSRSSFAHEIEGCLAVIAQEVTAALQVYREGDDFVIPSQSHLVQARVA